MAWRRSGDKTFSEPMLASLLTHICITVPQWVNPWGAKFTLITQSTTFHELKVAHDFPLISFIIRIHYSVIITWSNISFHVQHCNESRIIQIIYGTHKRRPIARPWRRAMGHLVGGFLRKFTVITASHSISLQHRELLQMKFEHCTCAEAGVIEEI